jgi:hypothetical protein
MLTMYAKLVAACEVMLAPDDRSERMLGGDGAARELPFDVVMLREDERPDAFDATMHNLYVCRKSSTCALQDAAITQYILEAQLDEAANVRECSRWCGV